MCSRSSRPLGRVTLDRKLDRRSTPRVDSLRYGDQRLTQRFLDTTSQSARPHAKGAELRDRLNGRDISGARLCSTPQDMLAGSETIRPKSVLPRSAPFDTDNLPDCEPCQPGKLSPPRGFSTSSLLPSRGGTPKPDVMTNSRKTRISPCLEPSCEPTLHSWKTVFRELDPMPLCWPATHGCFEGRRTSRGHGYRGTGHGRG